MTVSVELLRPLSRGLQAAACRGAVTGVRGGHWGHGRAGATRGAPGGSSPRPGLGWATA